MSAVHVDDYLLAAVQDAMGKLLQRTERATLHAIHNVFPPPKATGTIDAKDPISEKKLAQGEARWATLKEILGDWLDGRQIPHSSIATSTGRRPTQRGCRRSTEEKSPSENDFAP
jgi:hypothetical protein